MTKKEAIKGVAVSKNCTSWIASIFLIFLSCLLMTAKLQAADAAVKGKDDGPAAASWSELNVEKRCEGLLKFFNEQSVANTPDWKMIKPQCVISGSVDKDTSWSFEASWQRGAKALPLRFVVSETRLQKPRTSWCVIKGKKSGCASPWENSFTTGDLFVKKEEALAAFQGVIKMSQGFLGMATKLDEWVSKPGGDYKIFDLTYAEWVKAWSKSTRSLPVKKEIFKSDFKADGEGALTGLVIPKEQIPAELRECLGCAKTPCEKAPISFVFWGLGLTISRETTPDERQASGQKSGRASWVMLEPTPFVGGEPKWPFMCGAHRMSIQKL